MDRCTAFWIWDESGSSFTDYTSSIRQGASITIDLDLDDIVYVGFDRRMRGFLSELSTNGSYGTLSFEYFNGSWNDLSIITSYSFTESKYCDWVVQDDWVDVAANTTDTGGFPNSGAA